MTKRTQHLGRAVFLHDGKTFEETWRSDGLKIPHTMSVNEAKDKARDIVRDSEILKELVRKNGPFGKRPA